MNMRNNKVCLALTSFLVLGCLDCTSRPNKAESARNKAFITTIARIIVEVYETREDTFSQDRYGTAYKMKERTDNASNMLDEWRGDQHPQRHKVTTTMERALSKLKDAANAMLAVARNPNEESAAVFGVKLEDGRRHLVDVVLQIGSPDHGASNTGSAEHLYLTEEDQGEVMQYLSGILESRLKRYENPDGSLKKDNLPQELWALELLRGFMVDSPEKSA